jgi:transposase
MPLDLTSRVYFAGGMPNPYDVALRERAVTAYEAGGGSYAELADAFAIAKRTLERWVARQRATGDVGPLPKRGGWRSPVDLAALHAVVQTRADATCEELRRAYNRTVGRGLRVSRSAIARALRRAGYVLKKNGRGRVRSTGRMSALNAKHS